MVHSKQELINKRIKKLTQEDFDLDAWKETTYAVLLKILPSDDPRLKQVINLKVDYGSWALRDATSSYNPIETAKKKGKEVLESVLDELDTNSLLGVLEAYMEPAAVEKIKNARSQDELKQVFSREKKELLTEIISQITFLER